MMFQDTGRNHKPTPRRASAIAAFLILALAGCRTKDARPVEDLGGGRDVSRFVLTSIKGTRDGDRLAVRAVFGAAAGERIQADLHFTVGVPTSLKSGTWTGLGSGGGVKERSVTFLGGQSGPPSIGGRFDFLAPDGSPRYRVTIPLQELKDKL
jgi:hypothetical protein